MSIITLGKVSAFSLRKELYEPILVLEKLQLILYVIPLFFTYKISNPTINSTIPYRPK